MVALTYNDKYYITFTVEVRAKGSDISSSNIYEWQPWSNVINVKAGADYQSAIRGILTIYSGIIGEAYNDTIADKVLFTYYDYPVIYTGYDTNIISVDSQGNITALNYGSTVVTVIVGNQKAFNVTVNIIP
ncbi:MAG: hypothetical protein IKU52_03835 [Clostridia bacterium]|nr:hypothetical protein [Clostridia bacterium]